MIRTKTIWINKEVEITFWGTIWFASKNVRYYPFRDFIGNNYHGFRTDSKDSEPCCYWMILE